MDWLFYFLVPTSFWVPECHQKGVKSCTGEKGLFFSFSVRPWGENRWWEVVHDRRGNCKTFFATFRARKCVTVAFTSKSVSFGSIVSLVLTMSVVEVHSRGDSTVIFASWDSVWVKYSQTLTCTSSFETEDTFQKELSFTSGKILAMQPCWNNTRHQIT